MTTFSNYLTRCEIIDKYKITQYSLYIYLKKYNFPSPIVSDGRRLLFYKKDVESWFKSNQNLLKRRKISKFNKITNNRSNYLSIREIMNNYNISRAMLYRYIYKYNFPQPIASDGIYVLFLKREVEKWDKNHPNLFKKKKRILPQIKF